MRGPGHILTAAILIILISVHFRGCRHNSVTTPCPSYEVGEIEGFVRGGGVPVQAKLRAIPVDGYDDTRFRTRTDSTGWYRMELPSGAYRLSLLPPDFSESEGISYSGMDTVRVGNSLRRFDLNEGSLEVRAIVPAFLDGRVVTCALNGRTADSDREATVHGSGLTWTFPLVHVGAFGINLGLGETSLNILRILNPHGRQTISVGRDEPTVYEADLSTLSELVGGVHGSWETIHAGRPWIQAFGADSTLVGEALAGADGRFALDVFPAQPVRLHVGDNPGGGPLWADGDSYESARVYDLNAGARMEGVEILESGILCHLDWPGLDAAQRARFLLVDTQGRAVLPYGWSYSGRIEITDLRPGRYFLHLEHDCDTPWAPQWYDGSATLANATPIEITALGETAEVTMHLVEGGRIGGRVLLSPGGAYAYSDILLFDSEGTSLCETWSDESTGVFVFQGLADGVYRLAVRQSSTQRWWFPGTADPDSAGRITVADHAAVSGIEWRAP